MHLGCRILGSFIDIVKPSRTSHLKYAPGLTCLPSSLSSPVCARTGPLLSYRPNTCFFSKCHLLLLFIQISVFIVSSLELSGFSLTAVVLVLHPDWSALRTSLTNTLSMIILHLPVDTHFLSPVYQAVAQSPSIFPGMSYSLDTPWRQSLENHTDNSLAEWSHTRTTGALLSLSR